MEQDLQPTDERDVKKWPVFRTAPFLTLVVVISGLVCSCTTGQRTADGPGDSLSSDRAAYEGSAERRLAALGARIDSLERSTDTARVRTKEEFHEELADLRKQRDEAARKLEALKRVGARNWSGAKRNLVGLLDAADVRFDALRDRMRAGLDDRADSGRSAIAGSERRKR